MIMMILLGLLTSCDEKLVNYKPDRSIDAAITIDNNTVSKPKNNEIIFIPGKIRQYFHLLSLYHYRVTIIFQILDYEVDINRCPTQPYSAYLYCLSSEVLSRHSLRISIPNATASRENFIAAL